MFDKSLCEFAECVHYRIPKRLIGPDLNKWDDRWGSGIFLGIRPISNEVYVGTKDGILKCRTIRRKAPDARWNIELLNSIKGLPWDFKPQGELPSEQQLQPLPDEDKVNPVSYTHLTLPTSDLV